MTRLLIAVDIEGIDPADTDPAEVAVDLLLDDLTLNGSNVIVPMADGTMRPLYGMTSGTVISAEWVDPEPCPLCSPVGPRCRARDGKDGFICSRPAGHPADETGHAACAGAVGGDHDLHRWPCSTPKVSECPGSGERFIGAVTSPFGVSGRCPTCRSGFVPTLNGRVPIHTAAATSEVPR